MIDRLDIIEYYYNRSIKNKNYQTGFYHNKSISNKYLLLKTCYYSLYK